MCNCSVLFLVSVCVCRVHRQTRCKQVALEALMFTSLSAVTCLFSSILVITAVETFI